MNYNNFLLIDYGLPLLGIIITAIAQIYINKSYSKYQQIPIKKRMTGFETARAILDANGVSVAAHECGHAIQDKENYTFLRIRAFLVPLVNFSSKFGYIVVIIGLIFNILGLAKFGIYLLLLILLFQLVTLPVEFNASSRANKQLKALGVLEEYEQSDSKTMLRAAALTYVASLMSTLLQILRLALIVIGKDDD